MEDLSPDEWEELMSVEENHGRTRAGGSWLRLDRAAHEFAESGFEYFVDVEIHGLLSTYNTGCRCLSCRRAFRDYRRVQRKR